MSVTNLMAKILPVPVKTTKLYNSPNRVYTTNTDRIFTVTWLQNDGAP